MRRNLMLLAFAGALAMGLFGQATATFAVSLTILNHSFEFPTVPPQGLPAIPAVDDWEESGPIVMNPQVPFPIRNVGVFRNSPPGSFDHLTNIDGAQAAFIGTDSTNGITQVLSATYVPGARYELTAAFATSFFAPVAPDSLSMELLYQDPSMNLLPMSSLPISPVGLSSTSFTDITLGSDTIFASDPWAGRPIAVRFVAEGVERGFWDVDNVRLEQIGPDSGPVVPEPATAGLIVLGALLAGRRRR